ncbi:translation initiation factor IF-2 isoform X2 [Copidosoma floridanum]|uniref:translation initiation factor IF-2 isoform X2 n=1 Tax=Copidosoma floridanum TaxID=29053 RepID=UPI0006C9BE19|nr:translation initiation factor IF-2 isoform X2 [Copidosoma floridanum]
MGKPTKNDAGSGGDERNVERKQRAGSNPSKASSSNTVKSRLGDNETSRLKTGVRQSARQSIVGKAGLKFPTNVTIHTPLKTPSAGLGQPTNRGGSVTKPTISSTNKEVKKASELGIKPKSLAGKMKQESESSEPKPKANVLDEFPSPAEIIKQQAKESSDHTAEQQPADQQNGLNGGKTAVDENGTENGSSQENGKSSEQNGQDAPSERDEEIKLQLEAEDQGGSDSKPDDDVPKEPLEMGKDEDSQNDVKTSSDGTADDLQTDTESYSVDVVESTTSEPSEATESTAAPSEVGKDDDVQNANDENAMLEASRQKCSVQLMDCMRDPQAKEVSVAQQSEPENPPISTNGREYIRPRARPSIRRNFSYNSTNRSLFLNRVTEEGGPSCRIISDNYRKLLTESAATSTNGASLSSKIREANMKRKANEANPVEEKKAKLVGGDSLLQQKTQLSATSRTIKPVLNEPPLKKWCTIM